MLANDEDIRLYHGISWGLHKQNQSMNDGGEPVDPVNPKQDGVNHEKISGFDYLTKLEKRNKTWSNQERNKLIRMTGPPE